jgi:hypothetical protein
MAAPSSAASIMPASRPMAYSATTAGAHALSITARAYHRAELRRASLSDQKVPSGTTRAAWRKDVAKLPPQHLGCFSVSYPALRWHSIPCEKSEHHYPEDVKNSSGEDQGPKPALVGVAGEQGEDDVLDMVAPGSMSSVTGSFPSETGPGGIVLRHPAPVVRPKPITVPRVVVLCL